MKMYRKKKLMLLTGIVSFIIIGYTAFIGIMNKTQFRQNLNDISALPEATTALIAFEPQPLSFNRDKPTDIPAYDLDSTNSFQLDFRHVDLSEFDLSESDEIVRHMMFDTNTVWPQLLPQDFDPQTILENGKKPGLGVKELHKIGVDGSGVGIAIIDANPLLLNHDEYKDNLKFYEEIHVGKNTSADMHASAVSSIAVGKNIGVAPGADLYYFTSAFWDFEIGIGDSYNFTWMAKAIDRVLEINEILADENKIKVISISMGWTRGNKGYNEIISSIKEAQEKGVFVISTSLDKTHGLNFAGLDRDLASNLDDFSSYSMGSFMSKDEERFNFFVDMIQEECLLVPMDRRTYASASGHSDYEYSPDGGFSWCVPYIAGLYALALQVQPEITPEAFWSTALETGDSKLVTINDVTFELGKIVNPSRLIERLSN